MTNPIKVDWSCFTTEIFPIFLPADGAGYHRVPQGGTHGTLHPGNPRGRDIRWQLQKFNSSAVEILRPHGDWPNDSPEIRRTCESLMSTWASWVCFGLMANGFFSSLTKGMYRGFLCIFSSHSGRMKTLMIRIKLWYLKKMRLVLFYNHQSPSQIFTITKITKHSYQNPTELKTGLGSCVLCPSAQVAGWLTTSSVEADQRQLTQKSQGLRGEELPVSVTFLWHRKMFTHYGKISIC